VLHAALLLHVRGHRALLPRAAAVRRGPEDLEAEGLEDGAPAACALYERVQRDAEDGPADADACTCCGGTAAGAAAAPLIAPPEGARLTLIPAPACMR